MDVLVSTDIHFETSVTFLNDLQELSCRVESVQIYASVPYK